MGAEHTKRRKTLLAELAGRKLDCLVVTHPADWYYLTGFTGESGALIVSRDGATLLTDGRFTVQAKEETHGVGIVLQQGSLYPALGELLRKRGCGRVGYDANQLTVAQWNTLRKALGSEGRGFEATGLVAHLRMRKDAQELEVMRKAAILAGEVLEGVLKLVRPGVRESELGAEIEYQMKKRGASGASFETIVASGPRGALPHARPTAKKLRKN
jgi:Xaa-Pro aminopeptidase